MREHAVLGTGLFRLVFLATASVLSVAPKAPGQSVAFPGDAGVLDVTDFGVLPGAGDDTAALQALLNTVVTPPSGGGDTILYFPDGEYNFSSTVQIPAPARFINLQGQSQSGVVFKLDDNLPGFSGAMFNFGGGSADRFENSIRNLTLDIGSGNPDAIGLQFNASNQGVARDLTIRSSDPAGVGNVGFDVGNDSTIGPLLVKNLTVEGFDIGIRSQFEANSKVFEDITLLNQISVGWQNSNTATVMVRNLNSTNAVPAIVNGPAGAGDPGNGRLVLVGGSLNGVGAASTVPAIRNTNFVPKVYIRDVEVTGYDSAISREVQAFQGNTGLPAGTIGEYWFAGPAASRRGGTFQLFDGSPDTSLGLPVKNTPNVVDEPPANWVSPLQFGALPDDGIDDTAAIQAAIDSGARTVYLPNGSWQVEGTVQLRGSVERLIGTDASVETTGPGSIVLGPTGPNTVVVERISGRLGNFPRVTYEHASDRTWVFKNVSQWDYDPTASAPGDLFLEDVSGASRDSGVTFRNQNVWARQYNNEVPANTTDPLLPDAKITNDGANLWILGFKTENEGTLVRTIGGGKTELLGVYRNGPGQSDSANPAFVTEDATTSVAVFSIRPNNDGYDLFASETRGATTQTSATFSRADVYSGFDADDLWDARREIILDNADAAGVSLSGTWTSSQGFDGGFIGEDFLFSDDSGATASLNPDIPLAGDYEVFLRWINDRGGQDHSGHSDTVPVDVTDASGVTSISLDQQDNGGRWVSLGVFDFAPGTGGGLEFSADGAGGKVIVDGARFVYRPTPGDIDADGDVDANDLANWHTGFGDTGDNIRVFGDANEDGDVDIADLLVIQRGLAAPAPPTAAQVVPEPSGVTACLAAAVAILLRPRRNSA